MRSAGIATAKTEYTSTTPTVALNLMMEWAEQHALLQIRLSGEVSGQFVGTLAVFGEDDVVFETPPDGDFHKGVLAVRLVAASFAWERLPNAGVLTLTIEMPDRKQRVDLTRLEPTTVESHKEVESRRFT